MLTHRDLPALLEAWGANQRTSLQDRDSAQRQQTEGQQSQALEKLKAYLQTQQAQAEPALAGQKQSAQNTANLDTLQDPRLQSLLQNGGSVKAGDIAAGADPYAHAMNQQTGKEDSAYKNAVGIYQKGVGSAATSVQALHTMLGALQSNDPSSMGQIRTAMVLANGFKRYNDNEGTALTPDDKQADVSSYLAKYGIGLQDKTLSDVTRSNVVRFANNKLDDLQDAHNTLKSQAQNAYAGSSFANPAKAANLGAQLGAPVDQQLQSMKAQFDKFHSQAIPQTPAQGITAPSTGLGGFFSQLGQKMGLSGGQPPAAPQASPQQPAPQAPPQQQGFDPDAFLKGQ